MGYIPPLGWLRRWFSQPWGHNNIPLVGGWVDEPYPSEKWWISSVGDYEIPNIWKKKMFQTTNQSPWSHMFQRPHVKKRVFNGSCSRKPLVFLFLMAGWEPLLKSSFREMFSKKVVFKDVQKRIFNSLSDKKLFSELSQSCWKLFREKKMFWTLISMSWNMSSTKNRLILKILFYKI